MREIKFRAWDKVSKKILYQESLAILTNGKVIITAPKVLDVNQKDETYLDRTGEFEIQQFTGLKDKNGKEIYEGDIVIGGMNYSGEQFYKGYIHWFADGAEYWALADFSEFGGKWNDRFTKLLEGIDEDDDSTETDTLEIIGNIYENPELIK